MVTQDSGSLEQVIRAYIIVYINSHMHCAHCKGKTLQSHMHTLHLAAALGTLMANLHAGSNPL